MGLLWNKYLNFSFLQMLTSEIMKSECGKKQSGNAQSTFYQSFEKRYEKKEGGSVKQSD